MAKKPPSKKKATPKASPRPELSITGLSEGEMEFLNRMNMDPTTSIGTSDSSLQSQNAALIAERDDLKEQLRKAYDKCDSLQKDLDRTKGELDTAKTNLDTNRRDNEALRKEVEDRKSAISSKNTEIEGLNEQLKVLKTDKPDVYRQQSEQEIERLESENKTLKGEKAQLTKDLDKERGEKRTLEDSVASLEARLSEANAKAEKLQGELDNLATQDRSKVAVTRSDARTLRSQSFEDGNYDIRLAADRSYITFRKDPQGRALCWNHEIAIPKLPAYIDFDGEKSYEGEESDSIIRISLRWGAFMTDGETLFFIAGLVTGSTITISLCIAMRSMKRKGRSELVYMRSPPSRTDGCERSQGQVYGRVMSERGLPAVRCQGRG